MVVFTLLVVISLEKGLVVIRRYKISGLVGPVYLGTSYDQTSRDSTL